MERARRVPPRLSPPPMLSIPRSVLRLARVTGQTALQDAQEVGGQLMTLAQQTLRGTRAASVAIARDVAETARRAAAGVADGVHELRQDITRWQGMLRRPATKMTARRGTPARRRRRGSGRKASS